MNKNKLLKTLYRIEESLEFDETKEGLILGELINELQELNIIFKKK